MKDFVVMRENEGEPIDGLELFNTSHPIAGNRWPVQFAPSDSVPNECIAADKYGVLDRILPLNKGLPSPKLCPWKLTGDSPEEVARREARELRQREYDERCVKSQAILAALLPKAPAPVDDDWQDEGWSPSLCELLVDWLEDNNIEVDRLRISIAEENQ